MTEIDSRTHHLRTYVRGQKNNPDKLIRSITKKTIDKTHVTWDLDNVITSIDLYFTDGSFVRLYPVFEECGFSMKSGIRYRIKEGE